jgi:hypothetical protein
VTPQPPPHVQPYVDALGAERALDLLLVFGGSEVYLASRPTERSRVAQVIGTDGVTALAAISDALKSRIPTARPWCAACLHARGLPVAEIARRLSANDSSVRRWLKTFAAQSAGKSEDPRQLSLIWPTPPIHPRS